MTHRVTPNRWVPKPAFNYPLLPKVVSRLRIPVPAGTFKLKTGTGPEGRMMRLRHTVTALIKFERLELNFYRADVCQGYSERLIADAIRYGPESADMMDMADYWLLEKQLVHKLFKVLVPRFQTYSTAYTRLYNAPRWYFSDNFHPELNSCPYDREINEPDPYARLVSYPKAVLELKGHPFPPILPNNTKNPSLLHNVLLSAARADHHKQEKKRVESSPVQEQIAESEEFESVESVSIPKHGSGPSLTSTSSQST